MDFVEPAVTDISVNHPVKSVTIYKYYTVRMYSETNDQLITHQRKIRVKVTGTNEENTVG